MTQLDQARRSWSQARAAAEQARTAQVRSGELLRQTKRQLAAATRTGDKRQIERLQGQLREAEGAARKSQAAGVEAAASLAEAAKAFAAFTDPVEGVSRLSDDTPFALFPLRLETRYLTLTVDGVTGRFLCVRAFPDDVLVDTFQPEISQTELDNTVIYWTHYWRAGGDPEGRRAAWAALVKSHGAGRAHWLLHQVAPLNPQDEPVAGPDDNVLVILPAAPVAHDDKDPIATFWERVWSSRGADRDAAFAGLAGALGADRASEVEATLQPVNLRDTAVKPAASIRPVVAFLDLPQAGTLPISQADWTRPARAWLLPERLVLLGFRGTARVLQKLGALIPAELQLGPDPGASGDEQFDASGADLEVPPGLQWMTDFETARRQGMAFAVTLAELGGSWNLDQLMVLGVRMGSDPARGAAELSQLIGDHQNSRKGFAVLPQGRPTNNTDTSNAGYTWWEDPDESYHHFFEIDPADDPLSWQRRKDGAWLAGMLGVDPAVLRPSPNYYGVDQAEARAMNTALWPATLGYYMEQMLEPVFSEETVRQTRSFFNRFVIGRGTVPLVRIGKQPYGILPATAWSRLGFWSDKEYDRAAAGAGLPGSSFLGSLNELTRRAGLLWHTLSAQVSRVSAPGADPHQTLLDVVGLHPGSAELYQRYSQSFTQHYNLLGFATQPVSAPVTAQARLYVEAVLAALSDLGWAPPAGADLPFLLETIFLKQPNLLKGDLVQSEISDTSPLAITRADGLNYIAWIQSAARISHDALRKQEGFAGGPPGALLYLMLQHALDLGFVDTALALRRRALHLSDAAYLAERREPKFIQVAAEGGGKSRWDSLYKPEPAVTGDPARRLGDLIPLMPPASRPFLEEQLSALDVLKSASTGGLERALLEHIDCLSYRMDAWRSGMLAAQLSWMRRESANGFGKGGLLIGAYGWVEDLKPKDEALQPVRLDGDLAQTFAGDVPLQQDPGNFGYIHAPSLDHAVTAAILRNGHLANATPEAPDVLAVELTSERVRLAQRILEGIRNGQSLGALLGYQLERDLHDAPNLYLDRLIYALRAAFPLAGNRNRRTRVASLATITQVEARNVVDGEALLDQVETSNAATYPYGVTGLPALSIFTGPGLPSAAQIGAIVDGCVNRLRTVADAVADLAVAEGVYQVVRGNFDRAAGATGAVSKGGYPPALEVCATPRGGRTLTHRIALHLQADLDPADGGARPREQGEPALALWLDQQLPDPATVFARVSWSGGARTPSMADLGLTATDLFYLVDAGGEREFAAFDELLIDFAEEKAAPPHDAGFELQYKPAGVAGLTLFELAPLVRSLRGFVLGGRPLRATDLSRQSDASRDEDAVVVLRPDKAVAVQGLLQARRAPIDAFIALLDAAVGDGVAEEAARDAARDQIDAWLTAYGAMARPLAAFGLPAGGLTAGIEGRRPRLQSMLDAVDEIIARWKRKQDEYDAAMTAYGALPAATGDDVRIPLLLQAGRLVSTSIVDPIPARLVLETQVAGLRSDFDDALLALTALRAGAIRTGGALKALTAFLPTYLEMDLSPFSIDPFRASVRTLADDLVRRAQALRDDIAARIQGATGKLADAAAATGEKAQSAVQDAARFILGNGFLVLPEFSLSTGRRADWTLAWSQRAQLLDHLEVDPGKTPYPLEDWLHGVARVRERVGALELAVLLGQALGAPGSPALVPLQFPSQPNDKWLGLRFPVPEPGDPPFVLGEDKLLYTATFGPGAEFDPADDAQLFSGLLLDEWIEVIPADQLTTGLTFHFDRPNSEAPQAILLMTPPVQRGAWAWQDLVDGLRETLEQARLRAVEPAQLDQTAVAPLVPAVVSAVTLLPITAMLNFAFNNGLAAELARVNA